MVRKRIIVTSALALAASVTLVLAAVCHSPSKVSVSFVGYTNAVRSAHIVAKPFFLVPADMTTSHPDIAQLAAVVTNDPGYLRFTRVFGASGQPKVAVFRLTNKSPHKFLWGCSRITALPSDGSDPVESALDTVSSVLLPNADALLAVPPPDNCRRWRCEFTLCQLPEDPKLLYVLDRHTYSPALAWLHRPIAKAIIQNTQAQSRPRVLLGPDMTE